MLTQIQELLNSVVGSSSETPTQENLTVLEHLEQENSGNVTERHLLISEKEYEQEGITAQYGTRLSANITVNSIITYGLLTAIDGLTLSFNPFVFYLLTTGVNLIGSVMVFNETQSVRKNLVIGSANFAINTSINGQLIGLMNSKVENTRIAIEGIRREIEHYEAGYKNTEPNYAMIAIPVGLLIGFCIANKIIKGKSQ